MPTVLIVEDEVLIADEIKAFLCRNGYDVIAQVTAGEEAVTVAASKIPDVVVMDIKLQGVMDGITAAEKIYRELGIPCIFLTSYSDPSLLERAKKVGAFGYLVKPFDDFELTAMIDMALYKVKMEAEKRQLEIQLQQAMKMETVGTLAGGIAHDFNNILGVILGYSELIEEDLMDGGMNTDKVEEVIDACHQAKALVQQILTFSRKQENNPIPTDLKSVIEEMTKLLRASVPSNIDIRFDLSKEIGAVLVDPSQILQILINLCTNAAQAMEESGDLIVIGLDRILSDDPELSLLPGTFDTPMIRLFVSDNGPGIPRDTQKRIFEPYFTTKDVDKGSGLGLSVVHGIVKKSGGTLRMESEEGEGCTFYIYFPETDLPVFSTSSKEPMENVAHGEGHILLVDDDAMVLSVGKLMLTRLGYTVTTESRSDKALERFVTDPDQFDAVMTDQTMPGMTGLELARKMLAVRPELPILLCTGYSTSVDRDGATARGIKGFIMKPYLKSELAKTLHAILS